MPNPPKNYKKSEKFFSDNVHKVFKVLKDYILTAFQEAKRTVSNRNYDTVLLWMYAIVRLRGASEWVTCKVLRFSAMEFTPSK